MGSLEGRDLPRGRYGVEESAALALFLNKEAAKLALVPETLLNGGARVHIPHQDRNCVVGARLSVLLALGVRFAGTKVELGRGRMGEAQESVLFAAAALLAAGGLALIHVAVFAKSDARPVAPM